MAFHLGLFFSCQGTVDHQIGELGHDDLVMLDRRDFDDPGLVLRRERLALQQELEFLQDQADGPDDSEDSAEESDML